MAFVVKQNEAANPVNVSLLCGIRVMLDPHCRSALGRAAFEDEVPTSGSSTSLYKMCLYSTSVLLLLLGRLYGTLL